MEIRRADEDTHQNDLEPGARFFPRSSASRRRSLRYLLQVKFKKRTAANRVSRASNLIFQRELSVRGGLM